ncbi:Protein of unknown function [Pyronema omphalodes CBS 100304]|uniref:MYND-type domain-containing protein n=1 Tax=Pyronema omphalodes (strain CBS 100304) TaxID=1076935 RepID=U4L717_PYROM|nr:Protein of unknown function [Pyronema omphalodes CBS 100304]
MACRTIPKKVGIGPEGLPVDLDGHQPPGTKPPVITAEKFVTSKYREYLLEQQSSGSSKDKGKGRDKGKGKAKAVPDHRRSSSHRSTQVPGGRPGSNLQLETKIPEKEFRMEIPAARRYTPPPGSPSSSRTSTEISGGRPTSRLRFEVKLPEEGSGMEVPEIRKPAFLPGSPSSLVNPFMRDDRLEFGGGYVGKKMAGRRGERDGRATYESKLWKQQYAQAGPTMALFVPDENVHPGHMVGGFGLIKQDRPVSIQTLDSRHDSALAAIQEAKKRKKEVRERRRIKALGRGEIPWDSESSSSSEDHILDSSDVSASDAESLRSERTERAASPPVPSAQSTRGSTGALSVGSPVKTLSPLQRVEKVCRAASDENYTDEYYGARQRARTEPGTPAENATYRSRAQTHPCDTPNSASLPPPHQRSLAQYRYTPYQQFSKHRPPPIYEDLEDSYKDDSEDSPEDSPENYAEGDAKDDSEDDNSLTSYEHQPGHHENECEIALEQPAKDPPMTFLAATVSWLPSGTCPSPEYPFVNPVACTLGVEFQFGDSTGKGMIPQHPAIHLVYGKRQPNMDDQIFLTISAPGSERIYCKVYEDYIFFLAELDPPPKVAEALAALARANIITKTGLEIGKKRFQQYKVMLFLSNLSKKCTNCEQWEALAPNPRYVPEAGINRHYYRRKEMCSCKVAWFCNRDCMIEAWNGGIHHEVCLDMRGLQHENLEQYRRRYQAKQAKELEDIKKREEADQRDMQKQMTKHAVQRVNSIPRKVKRQQKSEEFV